MFVKRKTHYDCFSESESPQHLFFFNKEDGIIIVDVQNENSLIIVEMVGLAGVEEWRRRCWTPPRSADRWLIQSAPSALLLTTACSHLAVQEADKALNVSLSSGLSRSGGLVFIKNYRYYPSESNWKIEEWRTLLYLQGSAEDIVAFHFHPA